MALVTDTDDYEKSFITKYLERIAAKKIEELQCAFENTTDSFERLKIKREIQIVKQALETELTKMEQTDENVEKVELGGKTNEIGDFLVDNDFIYNGYKIPMNLWNYLFDYQKQGVKWMLDLYSSGKGGVLADEMGLGKTIQVCTMIVSLFHSSQAGQFLILSPATVISNWIDQLKQLNPCPEIYRELSIREKGVFVLSYESFRRHKLLPIFDAVFLDEGHKIKNKESLISQAAKRIQAQTRFVITGTPIQNNLGELWSIFDFVNPNLLGSYTTFQDEFECKIKHAKTEREKQISYHYSVMLRSAIEPFILRRLKASARDVLPGKLDKVIFLSLSEKQTTLYLEAQRSKKFEFLMGNTPRSKNLLLAALSHFRKICNHPILLTLKNPSHSMKSGFSESRDFDLPDQNPHSLNPHNLIDNSSKLKLTIEMLDRWYTENSKVLLFFQTYEMLYIAKIAISSLRSKFIFFEMSGKTPTSKRPKLIKQFNDDPSVFVFLLTTRVGGLGLNLTSANRAIIYDPDWNPSTDIQAKERMHRYGQKSNVEIYRLICKGTIEEKIYQKQIYKDCLSKKILSNPDTNFDRDLYLDLLDFQPNLATGSQKIEAENASIKNDELITVKEEDRRDFQIFKKLNSKSVPTGKELIDYIKRREYSLAE